MIETRILEKTSEALRKLYEQEISPDKINIEKTRQEIEGDFTIVVFPFLKLSRKSPEATASEIGDFLLGVLPEIKEYKVIKGFLNLIFHDSFWISFLDKEGCNQNFGMQKQRHEKPVVIEYSSPNTNKPLHLGHIRNNLLGFSLAAILKANGYKVIKVNLVNDRGIHICKSMLAYLKWGNNETPESSGLKSDHLIGKYYVLFNREYKTQIHDLMEKGLTEEEAENQAPLMIESQELLRKWEAKDPTIHELWKKMNDWAYRGFDETYCRLGVDFDKIYYESETYLLGKKMVIEGVDQGVLKRKEDGSIWADLRDVGLDEKVLLRSDGTSVYMTQDIGTAQLRYDEYLPSRMIYVVGNEQNYHFDVLTRVLAKLGRDYASHIFHLSYGMVELPQGKMKSREGTVVDADNLMDDMLQTAETTARELGKANEFSNDEALELFRMIGLGALKYFILKVDPKKNMLFNPVESIDFNGNTGPFIQYTYARIQSLLKKAKSNGITLTHSEKSLQPYSLLHIEREVLKLLYQFPNIVQLAGKEMSPAQIANYVFDLAKEYNQFYQDVPVLKEENPVTVSFRIQLSAFVAMVIKLSMTLLGIEVPSRM